MTETDADLWIVNGSGTSARIEIVSQSATEIGVDGEIENVRLVQPDVTATAVIANRVALCCISNLRNTLFLLIQAQRIIALLSFLATPTLMRYTVFLGAPSPSSDDGISYQWRTLAPTLDQASQDTTSSDLFAGFPSSALDAASRRISTMYENVIFADEDEDEGDTQIVEDDLIGLQRGGETKLFST
jgi:hypothetical protein